MAFCTNIAHKIKNKTYWVIEMSFFLSYILSEHINFDWIQSVFYFLFQWCNEITMSSSSHICRLIPFKDSTPSHIQMWVLTPRGSPRHSVSLHPKFLSLSRRLFPPILILIANINTACFYMYFRYLLIFLTLASLPVVKPHRAWPEELTRFGWKCPRRTVKVFWIINFIFKAA